MEVILRLLSELRFVLIAICGICCAAFLFAGLGSLRDLRRAVFRLERSAILGRILSAWLKAGLCIVIAAGIWAVTGIMPRTTVIASENPLSITPTVAISTIAPTSLPTADLSSVPIAMTAAPSDVAVAVTPVVDPNLTAQPQSVTPTLAVDAAAALPAAPPAIAATSVPTATTTTPQAAALPTQAPFPATPEPTPPPTEAPVAAAAPESFFMDCPSPDVQITNPVAGENVSGSYIVRGTAGFQVGGKYKVEILRPSIEGWAFLWENHNSVQNGVLMPNFNSGLFPPGVYVLRVSLVDGAGQETGIACRVAFRIAG